MIRSMQMAIIKKDFRSITANKRLFSAMWGLPLVLTLVLPTIFILTAYFVPEESGELDELLALLPPAVPSGSAAEMVVRLLLNNMMPVFFLLIPIMTASVMAASSFVGEKEKRTLETLLYCPLPLKQIFLAKILASFFMSMLVTIASFIAMLLVVELEVFFTLGRLILPDISWLVILLLAAPAISLIAITVIVRGSAKAKTVEESQQSAAFLVLPVMLLLAGQLTGLLMVSPWVLLALGAAAAVLAVLLVRRAMGRFNYETLLKV